MLLYHHHHNQYHHHHHRLHCHLCHHFRNDLHFHQQHYCHYLHHELLFLTDSICCVRVSVWGSAPRTAAHSQAAEDLGELKDERKVFYSSVVQQSLHSVVIIHHTRTHTHTHTHSSFTQELVETCHSLRWTWTSHPPVSKQKKMWQCVWCSCCLWWTCSSIPSTPWGFLAIQLS